MTLDERIRDNLESAAEAVDMRSPLPVDTVMLRGRRRRVIKTSLWASGIAVAFISVLFVVRPSPIYLADGETLLRSNPLVVQGVVGPEPRFDTSQLGDDVTLHEISDVSGVLDQVAREDASTGSWSGGQTFRMTLLGETGDRVKAYVTHSIDDQSGIAMQKRCVWTDVGGYCESEELSRTAALPGGLIQAAPNKSPGYTVGGRGDMVWEVAPEASVVMLTIDGVRSWTRPVSQIAVFVTDLRGGESVVATVFDQEGQVIQTNRLIAQNDETSNEASVCPITYPTEVYTPPIGYPATSSGVDQAWYGTDDLWTTLPIDGAYAWRKSVWWSVGFPGGVEEGEPPIKVTWQRLDVDSDPIVEERGTNAYTDQDGWFMIAGIDPRQAGCWEVTAQYEGTTLSYVYRQR